jgi:hypothetical protein
VQDLASVTYTTGISNCTMGSIIICTHHQVIWQIKSRRMRWAGHVARMEEGRNVYRVSVGKPERKRPLERPRRRWEHRPCTIMLVPRTEFLRGIAVTQTPYRTLSALRSPPRPRHSACAERHSGNQRAARSVPCEFQIFAPLKQVLTGR